MYLATFTFTVAVLPMLLLSYYLIPEKGKTVFLLLCSLFIYGWGNPIRVLYPLACICYDYGVGQLLERWREKRTLAAVLLIFSAVIQVTAMTVVRAEAAAGEILFPFGMAVYTLQGLGYLIGVYRGRHKANANFLNLSLYIMLFPLLYAGPLLSYQEFDTQLSKRQCNIICLSDGLELFIQGLAEKVVLADTFGYIFRELRQTTGEMSMLTAWLTTVTFTMYLYFELLGYSEMARGLGRAFGFDLPRNFNHPFFTSSITAFMQCWNISLLLWFQTNFRHFLFGKSEKKWQKYAVLILTWALIGAWYGMRLQYVIWGLAIGVLLMLDQMFLETFLRKNYVFGMLYTAIILHFVWVLFFVDSLAEVPGIWRAMLGFGKGIADQYGFYFFTSYIALLLLGVYIATDLFRNISERIRHTAAGHAIAAWKPLGLAFLLIFSLASMLYGERVPGLWLQL